MDAVERVLRISVGPLPGKWPSERYLQMAKEGERRWIEIEELFEIQYPMFRDAVSAIDPDFALTSAEEQAAGSAKMPAWNCGYGIGLSYVRWERCPATAGLPNPYEPWLEIWEHGGCFTVEHGQFVDVYDSEFRSVGCLMVRHA